MLNPAATQDSKDNVIDFEGLGSLPVIPHKNWSIFQFGRARQCNYSNFVGLEEVETNMNGDAAAIIYSLSRYAFRIAVDVHSRAARIFAGGFCSNGKMFIRKNDTITTPSGKYDGFAGNAVCIRKPGSDVWYDVTVGGQTYIYTGKTRIRTNDPAGDNSIVDGTLISVGGIVFLYRNIDDAEYERRVISGVPDKYASWKRICCPVSYMPLNMGLVASDALYINISMANPALGSVASVFSYTTAPFYEYLNNLDMKANDIDVARPFVFPRCGHVFGFLRPLYDICRSGYRGKAPCPTCRTSGPYVPLRISTAFELADPLPHIDTTDSPPTHVFNPCGHCTSKSIATTWASTEIITITTRDISGNGEDVIRKPERMHLCPYCGVALDKETPVQQLYLELQGNEE